jgi:hypothetical protein
MTPPVRPDTPPVAPTHLFRHSLRDGRVHPLLHLVQRYREECKR